MEFDPLICHTHFIFNFSCFDHGACYVNSDTALVQMKAIRYGSGLPWLNFKGVDGQIIYCHFYFSFPIKYGNLLLYTNPGRLRGGGEQLAQCSIGALSTKK